MKNRMRIASLSVTTLLLGTTLLTGCGTSSASSTSSTATLAPQSSSTGSNSSIAIPKHLSFPMTVHDDTGRTVVIPAKPTHIVSLTLGTDEILRALVPAKEISGVDYFATQPMYSHIVSYVERHHLRVLGSALGEPSAETLVAIHPDLILAADYDSPKLISQLQHVGIPTYEFTTFNSIHSIESHILTIGKLVGEEPKAISVVSQMDNTLEKLQSSQPKKKLSVLYYTNYQGTISIAGSNTTANSVIRAAGGVNVAANVSGWPVVSAEKILAYNPDVILIPNDSGSAQLQLKAFLDNPIFQGMKAVREHHVYTVSDGNLSAVSQYVVLGVEDVQQVLLRATHGA
ncbi:MAG: ABC transporter substrate-binding protein [Acidibacillus sp.]|nr:ABC transporter substrate-binding protein [Acidibacillus sp.]